MTISLPIQHAPEKPREGEPCNGCGYCCAAEPCGVALKFIPVHQWGARGPCLAMEFEAGRFFCGLVRHPTRYIDVGEPAEWKTELDATVGAMIARLLGVGKGCDTSD
jgi:hypothetical protein